MISIKFSILFITLTGLYVAIFARQKIENGFIMYCPCMGRFGNQAEQMLGALLFAKSVNRTLLIPPFIHYGLNHKVILEPLERIIELDSLKQFHHVMSLEEFVSSDIAEEIWPQGGRGNFYCYSARSGSTGGHRETCDALKGEPFKSFWNHFNITRESNSTMYKPLSTSPSQAKAWAKIYPIQDHPVLSFVGAPSPFPTHREAISIQKYVRISKHVEQKALQFKKDMSFLNEPYLSMHLRHGVDWKKACELLNHNNYTELFSSNQCTNYSDEEDYDSIKEPLQFDTCLPKFETMVSKLGKILNDYHEKNHSNISIVHIATDYDDFDLFERFKKEFPTVRFVVSSRNDSSIFGPMLDIYLMIYADVFIGNCISSFSAFPARIRTEQLNFRGNTHYFGQEFTKRVVQHDEL